MKLITRSRNIHNTTGGMMMMMMKEEGPFCFPEKISYLIKLKYIFLFEVTFVHLLFSTLNNNTERTTTTTTRVEEEKKGKRKKNIFKSRLLL